MDDDIAEISAVKRVLMRSGRQTVLATNASDAQVAMRQEAPELLIVASACDGGEALELARRLFEDQQPNRVPVIILGELVDAPDGAVVVPRPVDPAQLAEELKRALGSSAAGTPTEAAHPIAMARLSAPAPSLSDDERRAAADALRTRAAELRRNSRSTVTVPAMGLSQGNGPPPLASQDEVARQIKMAAVKAKAQAER